MNEIKLTTELTSKKGSYEFTSERRNILVDARVRASKAIHILEVEFEKRKGEFLTELNELEKLPKHELVRRYAKGTDFAENDFGQGRNHY